MQANLNLTFKHCFECELKQVTPMLHFQADQHGATLRATQVKPMLDRFLCREYKRENGEKDVPEDWRMDKKDEKKTALRYKLTILANGEPLRSNERKRLLKGLLRADLTTDEEADVETALSKLPHISNEMSIPKAFFANMPPKGEIKEKIAWIQNNAKELLLFPEPLTLRIYCREESLREFIQEKIKDFFLLHSFGTRTSKGFGSFVTGNPDEVYIAALFRKHYGTFIYADDLRIGNGNMNQAITYASGILQLMKSGINPPNVDDYRKGFIIRHFLESLSIGSDKRFMKAERIPRMRDRNAKVDLEKPDPKNGHQFIRALLGLAEQIDFRDDVFSGTVKMVSKDGSIERFRCPVTVRITSSNIYFLPEEYPNNFLGQEFLFANKAAAESYAQLKDNEKNIYYEEHKDRFLKIPPEFNLKKFLLDFAEDYKEQTLKTILGFNSQSFKAITNFNAKPLKKGGKVKYE